MALKTKSSRHLLTCQHHIVPQECPYCELARLRTQRDMLHAALVGIVGASTRDELEAMEAFMRSSPAPAADKAASIDAIHALLATLADGS